LAFGWGVANDAAALYYQPNLENGLVLASDVVILVGGRTVQELTKAKQKPLKLGDKPPPGLLQQLRMPSDAHSINSINAKTRFGGGNRNTSRTVAKGHVDLAADYIEITSGKAAYDKKTPTFTTSTGRVYGYHADKVAESGSSSIYPMRGNPGDFVNLTQAEFDILTQMSKESGLEGSAKKALEGMGKSGNPGINSDTKNKLLDLFNSKTK